MEQWFCIKPITTALHAIKLNAGQADTGHAVPGSIARQIQADVHDHNPRIVEPYTIGGLMYIPSVGNQRKNAETTRQRLADGGWL